MTLHKNKTVYAQKATKRVHQQGQEHGENVSTVHLANAPPLIHIHFVNGFYIVQIMNTKF